MITSVVLYGLAGLLLSASFLKNREKTAKSLKIAWGSFQKMLPSVITIMVLVGIMLSVLDREMVSRIIGAESGVMGVVLALLTGSVAVMPSFVAFPLGGALLKAGAGYPQVAALVSTIMAVSLVSLPMEMKYFDRRIAIKRAALAFVISVVFTAVIGWVM